MTKWESRTEDLGFFPKNEVAFLAFLAFSLLKPMQNGFFLLGFLYFCQKSHVRLTLSTQWLFWLLPGFFLEEKAREKAVLVPILIIERKIWEIGPQNVYFPAISREIDISQVCYLRSISREMLFPGKCGK